VSRQRSPPCSKSLAALPESGDARRQLEALRTRLSGERNRLGLCVAAIEQLGREESCP
jgi:hypothetical protein